MEDHREMCKRRNEVERLLRQLKGFHRTFFQFEKLDVMFLGFIVLVLIFDALRNINTPWLQVRRCYRYTALRAHGAALSRMRERCRTQDEQHKRMILGAHLRGDSSTLRVRDPKADGDWEEPQDRGSVLGMPGLSGFQQPGVRTDSTDGDGMNGNHPQALAMVWK